MKIAFIVGQFPVISETFILNQATGLIDRGHQVDIYADRRGDLNKLHGDVIKYSLLERTQFLPEIPENLLWRALSGSALFVRRLAQDPTAALASLNYFRHGQQALSLWLLYTIVPKFKQDYDIVHAQFGTVGFRAMAFRAMNAPRAKLVTIFRGHDISNFVEEQGRQIYDPLFQAGDYFLANCEFFKRRAIELGCPPDRIRVHGSGLDCRQFPFSIRQLPEDGAVRIATTGRLVEKKGIEYGIRAVAQLIRRDPERYAKVEYLIVGEGELRPQLEQLIQSLGMADNVKLLGQKSRSEIIDVLNTAHLFIAPSVTAASGNQDAPVNVLKEAMAMGMPVISTLHGGIPELVEEGISGYLVPERDAEAIANRLTDLLSHPERWPAMGEAGRAFVERHYDLDRLNDALVSLYESLLPVSPPMSTPTPLSLSH